MGGHGDLSDEEGLRLMQAFFKIKDADLRRSVIDFAEKLAEGTPPHILPAEPLPQDERPKDE
jgi:hypothetical protein